MCSIIKFHITDYPTYLNSINIKILVLIKRKCIKCKHEFVSWTGGKIHPFQSIHVQSAKAYLPYLLNKYLKKFALINNVFKKKDAIFVDIKDN